MRWKVIQLGWRRARGETELSLALGESITDLEKRVILYDIQTVGPYVR